MQQMVFYGQDEHDEVILKALGRRRGGGKCCHYVGGVGHFAGAEQVQEKGGNNGVQGKGKGGGQREVGGAAVWVGTQKEV